MKRIIYFPNPINSDKLASIITDKDISEIITDGIFDKKTKYLEVEYDTQSTDLEYLLSLVHLDFLKFDNKKKPTDIVLDEDAIQSYYIEKIRKYRVKKLEQLDQIQLRAWALDNKEIAKEVEVDKDALRNITETVNVKNIKTLKDFEFLIPGELLVNYNDKYKDRFKQEN
jgi:hypothetical protein